MATREEMIAGMEMVVQETRRLASDLNKEDWEHVVDLDGWKNQEVLAHIAGVSTLVIPMAGGLTSAPSGQDALAAIDIDQMNAGLVAQRAGKTPTELADEAATAAAAVIEFIKNTPQETLDKRVTVRGYKDVPLSDILMRMVVLHGLGHIYSVYASVMNRG